MYRKTIIVFLMGLAVLSFLPSMQASAAVIDLGTISYGQYRNIAINQTYDVDMSLIYTPIANDVTFQKLGYNPLTNSTVYYIQSLGVPVDYTFKNDTKTTLFQDTTGQVYRLLINYANITVPANPLKEPYDNLTLRYNESINALALMNASLANFTIQSNATLTALNASLANMTMKQNATYQQLLYMSLNASMANTRADQLACEKKNAENQLFTLTLIFIPVILLFCIISLYIAKKLGWFKNKEDRAIRKLESGYTPISEKIDGFVRQKNDDITIARRPAPEVPQQEAIEQPLPPDAPIYSITKKELKNIHGAIDKLGTKK